MNAMKNVIGVLFLALWLGTSVEAAWQKIELGEGWRLHVAEPNDDAPVTLLQRTATNDIEWLPIQKMPAMVHDVLVQHGRIETPWLPGRAAACRWVAEKDWVYAMDFAAKQPDAVSFLHFKGLDTIVDIYLNGERIATHTDTTLPLRVDVTGKLKVENRLALHFYTPFRADATVRQPATLKMFRGQEVRRSTHNYDSYLGAQPYLSRVGVFDSITLEISEGSEITEFLPEARVNESLTKGTVTIQLKGNLAKPHAEIAMKLIAPDGRTLGEETQPLAAKDGGFSANHSFIVKSPTLWWPRGYGAQPLYHVEATLIIDGQRHHTLTRPLGMRRITMPEHLHFIVNNVPVKLWGGNYIAPDWQTTVWNQPRVEQLFELAKQANFNTFRVWTDVDPPDDRFYELADREGFLLWNDFPLLFQSWNQKNTPPDQMGLERISAEATYALKRLKHHPSILIWCGGNEEPLWNDPEFNGFKDNGPWAYENATRKVGEICHALDPARPYVRSSPDNPTFPNDPATETHGLTHVWFVPGYDYINFASEDTRICAPTLPSMKKMLLADDLWPVGYSPLLTPGTTRSFPAAWEKYSHPGSERRLGPVEHFYDPTDVESLIQRLGMANIEYYQETIERQRRGHPAADPSGERRCGGYLVWSLNAAWPHIFFGKVDYFLEPCHSYYGIRRAFDPVLLSFEVGNYIWLWAVNDTPQTIEGTVHFELFQPGLNQVRKTIDKKITLAPGVSKIVFRLDQEGIGQIAREHILFASLTSADGRIITRTSALLDTDRRLNFPKAKLTVTVRDGALEITTDKFARTVCLSGDADGDELGWRFEDNYFDLLPGEIKTVRILGQHQAGKICAKPWYSPHSTKVAWKR